MTKLPATTEGGRDVWQVACTIRRMKRAGIVAGVVLLLALTGCSQSPADTAEAPDAVETTAPLVAESPDALESTDATYLETVREMLPGNTQIPDASDAQLIEAGKRACAELAAGTDTLTLSLIDGETPNGAGSFDDSAAIVTAAAITLCD